MLRLMLLLLVLIADAALSVLAAPRNKIPAELELVKFAPIFQTLGPSSDFTTTVNVNQVNQPGDLSLSYVWPPKVDSRIGPLTDEKLTVPLLQWLLNQLIQKISDAKGFFAGHKAVTESKCFKEAAIEDPTVYVPVCDVDGTYGAVQCNTSRCFCANKEGLPIDKYGADVETRLLMSCHCARARYEYVHTLGFDSAGATMLNCDAVGNYNLVQCLGSVCYCVNQLTGRQLLPPKTTHVDGTTNLLCGPNIYGENNDMPFRLP